MIEQHMGFFDMGLVFSAALGLGLWELISVRRALRQAAREGETEVPPRSGP